MTNSKHTKRALLASVLSVVMCVAMLVGTTFAWFTDSVTSDNNKIMAGNLDIELEYRDQAGAWKPVTETTKLFQDGALWEPGHTEVVYLKVKNAGTLALKYQLSVTAANETTFTNALGQENCRLSDYLVFGQEESNTEITKYATREDAWKKAGSTLGLSDYTKEAVLYPAEAEDDPSEQYVALVVYMPTSVGNEANYRGDVIPSIDLGVNLVATQTPYEDDSFGNDYDQIDFDEEGIIVEKNQAGQIVSAVVPEGTTVLKANTFKNQKALISVSLPSTLTTIEDSAFYACSSLEEIEIPDGVTSIGASAFKFCDSLTDITIPDSVTSIGNSAFMQAYLLENVKLSENLTSIESLTFAYCYALKEIEIPDGVTSIGSNAFYDCNSLTDINIPDNVTSIGNSVFRGCSSFTNIVLPDNVTSIGTSAFYDCASLEAIKLSTNLESIGGTAFRFCGKLKTIDLPAGLQSIGLQAFVQTGLTSIEIPASVTSIEENPVLLCPDLMTLTVADGNTVYRSAGNCLIKGNTIIAGCSGSDLTQTSGITAIASEAFQGSAFTKVTIPDTVTTIGDGAFQDCVLLKNISIPQGVKKIPLRAFSGCKELKDVTMGNSVNEIGPSAFSGCNISSITLPNTLTTIGDYGFRDCPLTRVDGCINLTSVGRDAFYCNSDQLEYLDLKFGYWNGSGAYKGQKITNGKEAANYAKKGVVMKFTGEADW